MDYNCRIVCSIPVTGLVDKHEYEIKIGDILHVQSQTIDKAQWFVYIPSIGKYGYIEKYHFDFLIDRYVNYPSYFGEFQLPVISENIHSYTCIQPSGYVTWISKGDARIKEYKETQRVNCDEIRFR
ncbi:hypothetical protein [Paenibacillus xylanexedens]|uniref:hypothetical protein n=1 Tax=Paenibacillus xylanexedens TaxID=528191 RepID=UPI0011A667CE|nr:hypothetical protein [Paenibacillus xylanexedens]